MIPEFEEFILPTLKVLAEGNTMSLQEVRDAVINYFGFSEGELQETTRSGNNTKVIDRTDWALTYLCQASLVERPKRAFAQVTFAGLELLENPPKVITRDFLNSNYPSFKDFNNRKRTKKEPVATANEKCVADEEEKKDAAELQKMKQTLFSLKNAVHTFESMGCSATTEQLEQIANLEASIKEIEISKLLNSSISEIIKVMAESFPKKDYVLMIKHDNGSYSYFYSENREDIELVPINAEKLNPENPIKQRKRRPNLNFFQMGLITGDELTYVADNSIKVAIVSENRVEYNGKEYSLTKLTQELKGLPHAIQPTGEWEFEGENLMDLYNEAYPLELD